MIERGLEYSVPEMVLLFDANMPSFCECRSGCEKASEYLCLHRLKFPVHVLYLDTREKSYSDLKVVLGFGRYLAQYPENLQASPYFGILTRDLDFLRDAERDYRPKRKNTGKLVFRKQSVLVDGIPIHVQSFQYKGQLREHILRRLIQHLNDRYDDIV